ncbi:unnamed protein product [Mytilus coruscus]|uniref:Uncharacterized protein n=1 Tax=Mytilus coruscus TaxID=42192 RepID=A0A6J8EPW0_MYTCO|nr:unnamed protein product [Mytilus coruscus]
MNPIEFLEQDKILDIQVTELNSSIRDSKRQKSHEREIRLKVSGEKNDNVKAYQKFTINSQSSALVNGPKADLFMENILPQIENYLTQNKEAISEMNTKISQAINNCSVVRNQSQHPDCNQTCTKGAPGIDSPYHLTTSKSDIDQDEEQEYLCSMYVMVKADKRQHRM